MLLLGPKHVLRLDPLVELLRVEDAQLDRLLLRTVLISIIRYRQNDDFAWTHPHLLSVTTQLVTSLAKREEQLFEKKPTKKLLFLFLILILQAARAS